MLLLRLAIVAMLISPAWGWGCRREVPHVQAPAEVREIRVLVGDQLSACRIRVEGPCVVRSLSGVELRRVDALPWTDVVVDGGVRLGELSGVAEGVEIEPERYGALRFAGQRGEDQAPDHRYAGRLRIEPATDGLLRAINFVDLESYVAGVVPSEVGRSFHDEALQAQAVAARTYALYQMSRRTERGLDVRATEGDQVYAGVRLDRLGARARAAVEATCGLVLSWDSPGGPRIFCAYYSAACGGRSQSLVEIQPGPVPDPLRGGVECDWCRIADGQAYRWGPTEITKERLFDNLVSRRGELKSLQGVAAVEVVRETEFGRIGEVKLLGRSGEQAVLPAEAFRWAAGSRVMRSTDCDLVDAGAKVRFENGRGFGHGVGLCQWGMEGQARSGRRCAEILHYYYPGARLVRAY